jgi:hypothetical protein
LEVRYVGETLAARNKHFIQRAGTIAWDTSRGLGCYRNRDGSLSFFCQYRVGSRIRKRTLGRVSELSITEARAQATELFAQRTQWQDLIGEARAKIASALTLGDCYIAYVESLKRKGASPNTLSLNSQNWKLRLSRHQGP